MGLLNQVGRLGKKPKNNKINKNTHTSKELFYLISSGIIANNKINELLQLGFTKEQILKNPVKLKHLIELYDNYLFEEIISKENLRNLIQEENGDLEKILKRLEKILRTDIGIPQKALLLSILDR